MNLPSLDVAIGLVFFFFVVSLLCSQVLEWIGSLLNLRGRYLERALTAALDAEIVKALYSTEPVVSVSEPNGPFLAQRWGRRKPAYLSSRTFADAVAAMTNGQVAEAKGYTPRASATDLQDRAPDLRDKVANDLGKVADRTEDALTEDDLARWFDGYMERVSGWYRRYTRWWLGIIGLLLAFSFGLDAIKVYRMLERQPAKAATLAASAQGMAQGLYRQVEDAPQGEPAPEVRVRKIEEIARAIYTVDRQLGHPFAPKGSGVPEDDDSRPLGYLITALATMLGAPFWFDLLNRLTNLRMAGEKPASTTEKK